MNACSSLKQGDLVLITEWSSKRTIGIFIAIVDCDHMYLPLFCIDGELQIWGANIFKTSVISSIDDAY